MSQTPELAYALIVILVCALAYTIWKHSLPVDAPVNQWVPAKESKRDLKLPEQYKKHKVLASTKCTPDIREHTIVTIADPVTGEITTLDRKEPFRWLVAESRKEFRLSYGYRGSERIARLTGTFDMVQVKGIHLGLMGSLDSDFQRMAGVSLAYRW